MANFKLYFNVETADGSFSENCAEAGIKELATEVKKENPDQAVVLEVVLENDGEIVYQDGRTVSARVELIP